MSVTRSATRWFGLGLCVLCLPALTFGAERRATSGVARDKAATAAAEADDESDAATPAVEMFAAIKSGDIEVKFIPKDDREARVMIKNNTKQPLNVQLPAAFAGVPVLAQARGAANGGMERRHAKPGHGRRNGWHGRRRNGWHGRRRMGGGMGGGGGGGGGFFNIAAEKGSNMKVAAEKVSQFKVGLVCLEHGKRNPTPKVPYEIRPIDTFTSKVGVAELLIMFGEGKVDQRSAQAAAWHLNNGMSWQTLAAKRIEHLTGDTEPYFSADQIGIGMRVAEVAISTAQEARQHGSARSGHDLCRAGSQGQIASRCGQRCGIRYCGLSF